MGPVHASTPFDRGAGQALSPAFSGFDQEQSENNLQLGCRQRAHLHADDDQRSQRRVRAIPA
jgi:hypothetical protein